MAIRSSSGSRSPQSPKGRPISLAICADKEHVFICPQCNLEVADPAFVRLPRRWWERRQLLRKRRVPICEAGHRLSGLLGNTTELSLPLALLLGFRNAFLLLMFGVLEDLRLARSASHLGFAVVTGCMLILGLIAFSRAWLWAGMDGPVHRLTERACGMAMGYLVPALVACHAVYFQWLNPVEATCFKQLARVFGAFPQR